MQKIKIYLIVFLLSEYTLYGSDFFKTTYSFSNISLNYLNWSDSTQQRTNAQDFSYLEYEGGSGHSWGETYIFVDLRNPIESYHDNAKHKLAFAMKPTLDIKIKNNFAFHIQDYDLHSQAYYTNDAVVGFSYKITTKFNFWAKPFAGYHYKTSKYYTGSDGYMLGWLFNYKYKQFSLFHWHEMTFNRDKSDAHYDNHMGTQGSLKLWYNAKHHFSFGIQYRYAYYELGSKDYEWGNIYSIKYNF